MGLHPGLGIGNQMVADELAQDFGMRGGTAAWGVHVLDADQPASAMRARIEPAGQGRHQ